MIVGMIRLLLSLGLRMWFRSDWDGLMLVLQFGARDMDRTIFSEI